MSAPKVLAFAGSTRTDSWNKKLIRVAAAGARDAGAEVTLIDLRDFPMPLYDGDLEAKGFPEPAKEFKRLMLGHSGLLLSSPEYNSSVSGVLKNAIDWASRSEPGEAPLAAFVGKVAGLVAASPGALGGLRGLVHLRAILGNIKVLVIPDQVAVSKAHEAFTPEGALKDTKQQAAVEKVGAEVASLLAKLRG
jgi:chromate reductase